MFHNSEVVLQTPRTICIFVATNKPQHTTMKHTILTAMFTLFTSLMTGCSSSNRFTSMDVETFGREIQKPGTQIVDVRTRAEYDNAHIPGAINIDVNSESFDQEIQKLDKSGRVAVYCRSGRRSKTAAERLVAKGFRVVELDGGILSWRGALEN